MPEFALSRRQWITGLAISAGVAPAIVSLPISGLFALDAPPGPFWLNLPGAIAMGVLAALAWVVPPALLFAAIALWVAQAIVRKQGVSQSAGRIVGVGAALGAATAAPYALALLEAPAVTGSLLVAGALTGGIVAAHCHRRLRVSAV